MNRIVAGRNPVTKAIVAAAEEQGWGVDLAKNGHIRLVPPNGRPLQIAFSPSDRRTALNDRARARRAGLRV